MRKAGCRAPLCALLCALLCACAAAPEEHSATLLAMDTVMEFTACGENGGAAVERAQQAVERLEGLLSVTDEGSEIYRANHGQRTALSPDTAALLETAISACASTDGALDVTIYPLVRAWGFTTGDYQIPDGDTIAALLEKVDYRQVRMADGVLSLPEGVELDLGGAAKGFAGDRVMDIFRECGISSGKISLGGNVQVLGGKPDGSPWRVAIRDPAGEGYIGVVEVRDRAVVTSGGYERYFELDGARYWHILNPSDGYSARSGLASVTIVSQSGVWADCWSTALFVMGRDRAIEYWRSQNCAFDFILAGEDGAVAISQGLEDSFTLSGGAARPLEVIRP